MMRAPFQANVSAERPRFGRSLLAAGAGLVGIRLLNAGLGLATVVVFTRLLSPDDYGLYVLVLTVAQFLALPLQMGVPVLLTREIAVARERGDPAALVGVRRWTRRVVSRGGVILGSIVVGFYAFVVAAGLPILQSFSWPLVLLIVALLPAIAEMKRVMGQLNGYRKAVQSQVPDGVIRPTLVLVLGGVGLWAGWIFTTGLLAVYLASAALAALGGWAMLRRAEAADPRYDGPAEIRNSEWWRALIPLTFFAAAGTIKNYSDVLMLGAMADTDVVAFYRVASQIAALGLFAQVAVNAVLSPRVAASFASDSGGRVQYLAVRGSRIAFAASLGFLAGLAGFGEIGFSWLIGPSYLPVYSLVVVLAIGTVLNAMFGGTMMLLHMTNREKNSANYAIFSALMNITLNLVLIPLMGAMGAALATVMATLAMQILAWRRLRIDLGLRTDAFARTT